MDIPKTQKSGKTKWQFYRCHHLRVRWWQEKRVTKRVMGVSFSVVWAMVGVKSYFDFDDRGEDWMDELIINQIVGQ